MTKSVGPAGEIQDCEIIWSETETALTVKKQMSSDLIQLGTQIYQQVMDDSLPADDLFDLIIESLPLCFSKLNTSLLALVDAQRKVRLAAETMTSSKIPQILEIKYPEEMGQESLNEEPDLPCLRMLLWETLLGAAWYAMRGKKLGADLLEYRDGFIVGLHALTDPTLGMGGLLSRVLEAGQLTAACAALLSERAGAEFKGRVGQVPIVRPGSGSLLIIGADLLALKEILTVAEAKQIPVFTGGEMVNAYGYADLQSEMLVGHVDLNDKENDFSAVRAVFTDFMPHGFSPADFGRVFTYGIAGLDEADHLHSLTDENTNELLWEDVKSAVRDDKVDMSRRFSTGWTYESLTALNSSLLQSIQEDAVKAVALVLTPSDGSSRHHVYSNNVLDAWQLVAGGIPELQLHEGEYPSWTHLGGTQDIISGVQLIRMLAGEMRSTLRGIPHRTLLPDYREELVGIMFALMSFGLQRFYLGASWELVFSKHVLNMLQDRWQLQLNNN